MKMIIKGGLLAMAISLLTACGGGGGSSDDPEPPAEKTFNLQLQSTDIRLSSSGDLLPVETDGIKRENLTVN